jgi:two-component system NtrC family sensor kinase
MRHRINSKLFFSIGFATIFIFGVLFYLFLNQQKSEHTNKIYREANIFSEIITRATQFNMPIGNRECVHRMMQIIGNQNGTELVRMFDKMGKIKFSTDKREVGTFVDMNIEACNTCHMQEPPLETLPQQSRSRIFRTKGHRVLAITTPIYNESTCYNGACHVHSKEESILGVLDVGMSLAEVDDEIKKIQFIFMLFTLIAILCFFSILAFFIQRLVTKPVKQLVNATQKVAGGNLDVEIPIKTRDEIGQLAMSFNQMVQDLKKANEKLQSWSSQLEKKVEERTEKLRLAREQLIQSEKMASMGVLSSSVAHEINNPLQGILTYIRLMLKILSGE